MNPTQHCTTTVGPVRAPSTVMSSALQMPQALSTSDHRLSHIQAP
eukprot:CAMPEP_0172033836 /NCGR_PEP_ID=MMETSP1041-20130122/20673_1 /TAXON_ID=464988 /ORGANISM="Hemiselmis andersenii, Strain CCMP439" /LENGTH=44 /DNA_ID= /DNA_START= /DNA_END= /DNA_ORIENTATION=